MGKYIEDVRARDAWRVADLYADRAQSSVPFVWSGRQWTTPDGAWRDWPLIRRGMAEWLHDLAGRLDMAETSEERHERVLHDLAEAHRAYAEADEEGEEAGYLSRMVRFWEEGLADLPAPVPNGSALADGIRGVAAEVESATDTRAAHLLSLASQFDTFRAPLNDPAAWVERIGVAAYSVHVRTSDVWRAFAAAEPVLVRSLGAVAGKRALFAAMDRRFGARRKLSGYEGWRGVALPE
ncbi:hypothetical protein [Streptomyces tsukubensis]|uniref:hypothetical protein n=1 Tax=Streptomyces tsukubensis TaxID=83656 RepID=UPI00344D9A99